MKKVFLAVLLCMMAIVITSCSNNSPRGVAEKALDCAIKEDYRGYLDCVYFPEDKKAEKEGYASMIEEKVKKGYGDEKKPVSYSFVSEDIDEEAGRATETFEVTYSNGKTRTETVDMRKEEDGKWYLKPNK